MTTDRPQLDPYPLSPYVAWAGHRNRDPILELFKKRFPTQPGRVLEYASGSGMHINYFAEQFKHLEFLPSDMNEEVFENIQSLTEKANNANVKAPIKLDLTQPNTWPSPTQGLFDVIFCINIFQVAPVSIAEGMMQCATSLLKPSGFLSIYGPFKVDGAYTTDSNKAFDNEVRSAGVTEWGLKDVADLRAAAEKNGMKMTEIIDMPANNFTLIFTKA